MNSVEELLDHWNIYDLGVKISGSAIIKDILLNVYESGNTRVMILEEKHRSYF